MHRIALAPSSLLALSLLLALALVTPLRVPAAPPTLLFGTGLSLTGRDAREGKLTLQGYDIWKAYVNAHGGLRVGAQRYLVDIKSYDDETNPQTAVRVAERLIDQDHVSFLLGPYGTASTFSASAVSERKHVPMVVTNGPASTVFDRGFRYIFGVQTPAKRYLEGIVAMALTLKPVPKTIAVASANLAFPIEVGQGAADYAQAHGIRVVYNNRFPSDATEVSSIVAGIKAVSPDIVLIAGYLQDSLLFQKGFKEQNVNARIFGYSVGPDTPDFREALGRDANYVFGGTQWTPSMTYRGRPGFYSTSPEYAQAFQKTFGLAPEYHNAESTAGCLAFQYAIEEAGSVDPERVRDALAKLDVVTFFGILKFDTRGQNVFKPMAVNQIQTGKLVTVWPAGVANGKPLYPTPEWAKR